MKKIIQILFSCFSIIAFSNIKANEKIPNYLIFKLKPEKRQEIIGNTPSIKLQSIFSNLGIYQVKAKFPLHKSPAIPKNNNEEKLTDLSLIYECFHNGSVDENYIIRKLIQSSFFEYAEPFYIPELCFQPNDPMLPSQYALTLVKAFDAWNLHQGDTNVVVGITDTGIDLNHPDLFPNIKINYADPINGIDDDGDGYTDNFYGWNTGDNNHLVSSTSHHGVHVAGISSAVVNNGIGIAGSGFKCKFLPVKIANSDGMLTGAYDGIVYAADKGCAIINCSWGSPVFSRFAQDVINYATINKNALVIAAAGNNNNDIKFYPAAYEYVLSVAATSYDDSKWSNSSFGYYVDISAPGHNIYSTWINGYTNSSGTSMAAPLVAGAAALVKSRFPTFTALQIGEILRVSADDISAQNNSSLANKLGSGRLNMFKALSNQNKPSLIVSNSYFTDNNDDAFHIGDTIRFSAKFTNMLSLLGGAYAVISTDANYLQIINSTFNVGTLNTLQSTNNLSSPFSFKILSNAPENTTAQIKLTVLGDFGFKQDFYFDVDVNVDYINIRENKIWTSIGSAGQIGYSDIQKGSGLGFIYKAADGDYNLLFEAGLMIGKDSMYVSDCIRGENGYDRDFWGYSIIQKKNIPVYADFDAEGGFNDANSTTYVGVDVKQRVFAWNNSPDDKYVIIQYIIKNIYPAPISNVYAGIFADWDIMNYAKNKSDYNAVNQLAYAYSTETNGKYAGIKLLSNTAPANCYAIDNISGGAGGIDLTSFGYSTKEKYTSLSIQRLQSGQGIDGNDIMHVMSSGPFNLNVGESIEITFALIAGDSLNDLLNSAQAAQTRYINNVPDKILEYNTTNASITIFPNPSQGFVNVNANIEIKQIDIIDLSGRLIYSQTSNSENNNLLNLQELNSGIYFIKIYTNNFHQLQRLIISK
ncbi:MAG: S8 family peptidase [Bacteroidia bacterium]